MDVAFDPVKFGWLYLGSLFRLRRFSGVMYSSTEERLSRSRKKLNRINWVKRGAILHMSTWAHEHHATHELTSTRPKPYAKGLCNNYQEGGAEKLELTSKNLDSTPLQKQKN